MPAPMPGMIAKGEIIEKLEVVMNTKRATFLQRISARTATGWQEDLVTVGAEMLPLGQLEEDHLRKHWFDQGGWWPREQPLDDLIRVGLIHAMNIADGKVPQAGNQVRDIDCYWVCSGAGSSVSSCVSDHQVTVLVFTPPPPVSDYLPGPYTGVDRIFTAQRNSVGPGRVEIVAPIEHVELVQPKRP